FLVAPLVTVFGSAFSRGFGAYWEALVESEALAAIRLTLLTALIAVPLNTIFGVVAARLVTKVDFVGRSTLLSLVDWPFRVSPAISGLVLVLLFGSRGWFAPFPAQYHIDIILAVPGIVLATTFVTFPLVAREV